MLKKTEINFVILLTSLCSPPTQDVTAVRAAILKLVNVNSICSPPPYLWGCETAIALNGADCKITSVCLSLVAHIGSQIFLLTTASDPLHKFGLSRP